MKRFVLLGLLLLCCGHLGCVQRRMTIVSDPPGAVVFVNGRQVGATPVDVPSDLFIYHGDYEIQLWRDGFEPLRVQQPIPPYWYQYPFVDFFSEHVWPFNVHDRRVVSFQMVPLRAANSPELLQNANNQRMRGQGIGGVPVPVVPAGVAEPPPTEPPPTVPPSAQGPAARLESPITPP